MTGVATSIRTVTFPAMGTRVAIALTGEAPARALGDVRRLFEEWEATLSRFRPGSELCRVNAGAGRPTRAGPLLRYVASVALAAAEATGGAFDPTLGSRMAAIGYDRPFGSAPVPVAEVTGRHEPSAWRRVRVDSARSTITLPAGTRLDFGGIAKGMAVDAAAEILARAGAEAALVSAGGDMRAVGRVGAEWQIGFDDAPSEQITLTDGALATSSRTRRQWIHDGIRRHHLIDPRTGLPAESGLRSVSVAAATCARAEVAAKAAFVLGSHDGANLLERLDLPALLVRLDGRLLRAGDWPE